MIRKKYITIMYTIIFVTLFTILQKINGQSLADTCDEIYCHGPILDAINTRHIFNDSKRFVDMPSKYSKDEVIASFNALPANYSNAQLAQWINSTFHEPGYELDNYHPADHSDTFPLLGQLVKDSPQALLAKVINAKWPILTRIYNASKLVTNASVSHLEQKHPFIVPGGRFIEYYYWDSFWILEGLLISNMTTTAKGVLQNMVDTINRYKFIPNGSRRYYLNRSQPPLLTQMLHKYVTRTGDYKLMKTALPALDKEYQFFMEKRSVWLKVNDTEIRLNRHDVDNKEPRPESYEEDLEVAAAAFGNDTKAKEHFYSNAASVAESGLDFSVRWMDLENLTSSSAKKRSDNHLNSHIDIEQMKHLDAVDLIPVDLNAIMYANERVLQRYYCQVSNERAAMLTSCYYYGNMARRRLRAMLAYNWDDKLKRWSDYNLVKGKRLCEIPVPVDSNRNPVAKINATRTIRQVYLSDLSQLWYIDDNSWRTHKVKERETDEIHEEEDILQAKLDEIRPYLIRRLLPTNQTVPSDLDDGELRSMLSVVGGVPMANIRSSQQWDYPNVWAPYQYYLNVGLNIAANQTQRSQGSADYTPAELRNLALNITKKWLHSAYCGYITLGTFFEKYDGFNPGKPGGGGEYEVQDGFGWTNGAIMTMIEQYNRGLSIDTHC